MQLTLTIKKEKKGIVWGHLFFMENLLVEYGESEQAVREKLQKALATYYELQPHSFEFIIETATYAKARRMVSRLKKKKIDPTPEVSFNAEFFV